MYNKININANGGFALIDIHIIIYACLIKKNGTLVVYYLFTCVFISPN